MRILGLQKITVIDYPEKVACLIFLGGCSFRCGFCYNSAIVLGDSEMKEFPTEYVLDFLKKRLGKLDAVCISGGEPLMTLEKDFVRKIKELGYFVKIDTNGSFPEKLKEFVDEKLVDYVAMDLKSCPQDYSKVAGVKVDLKKIEKSMKIISSLENYEFRTTVVERYHNVDKIRELGKWAFDVCGKKPKKYFLQGFKKFNDANFIDESFREEPEVFENTLNKMKKVSEEFFNEVGVRC